MLFTVVPGQGAGPSADELIDLIDQMVNRKMANLGKQMDKVYLCVPYGLCVRKMRRDGVYVYRACVPIRRKFR